MSGGNFINYGTLSSDTTKSGTSMFQVATNADGGYNVILEGNTMTSGNHTIDTLTSQASSLIGTSQFGINLRANTDPAAGSDLSGIGIGSVAADYDLPDLFKFNKGDILAGATTGSNYNTFTITYLVNVPPDLPAGIYNTTITLVCTAAF